MASKPSKRIVPQDDGRPLQAALAYAAKGLRRYPVYEARNGVCACEEGSACKNAGKHPRLRDWHARATTDAVRIREWWRKWPKANVGIATGAGSGIIAIDIDPRHGGDESLAKLVAELGAPKNPVTAETGGGGGHLVLGHPGGVVKNSSGIRPGIDIRGDGGGIVVWPSMHVSGNEYRWATGQSLLQRKPTALPAAWRRWLEGEGILQGDDAKTTQRDRADRETEETEKQKQGAGGGGVGLNGDDGRDRGASLPLCVDATVDLNTLTKDEQSEVRRAIARSLPSAPGTRNQDALFGLARRLKGISRLAGVNPICLRPIVEAWYERARATMSGKHDLEDCWAQFLNDWPRVEHPGDVDVEALAREMAAGAPHPACAALGFTKPPLRVLIGLCEKLQEAHGGAMFYLACRKAADALTAALGESIDKTACCEYLGALVAAGVLEVVKRGTTKRATRYRFVWRPGPAVAGDRPDWLRDGAKTSDESTGGQNT